MRSEANIGHHINYAFEKLAHSFYCVSRQWISQQILHTVLETMLAQEGLTEKTFNTGGK